VLLEGLAKLKNRTYHPPNCSIVPLIAPHLYIIFLLLCVLHFLVYSEVVAYNNYNFMMRIMGRTA
jgi:hypothetical protein